MALYSEVVMDHFMHPRNVGVIENADGIGQVGNAKCGDIMKIYLKIENDIIVDVKFETFGCGSAIASSSMATEMIKGKPLSEALTLTNKAVAEALGHLPGAGSGCLQCQRHPGGLREGGFGLRSAGKTGSGSLRHQQWLQCWLRYFLFRHSGCRF